MTEKLPPPKKRKQARGLPGRKPGRPLGSKSKRTVYREKLDQLKDAKAKYDAQIHHIDEKGIRYDKFGNVLGEFYGETPIEFMIAVMHDPKQPSAFRFQAAKESAPYRHAKLASIEVKSKNLNVEASKGKEGKPLTAEEAARVYRDLLDDE